MTCSGYPLEGLDSIDKNGKSGKSFISSTAPCRENLIVAGHG